MGSGVTKFDEQMFAVTFAEAGEHETAVEFLRQEQKAVKEKNRLAPRKNPMQEWRSSALCLLSAILC